MIGLQGKLFYSQQKMAARAFREVAASKLLKKSGHAPLQGQWN